MPANHAGLLRLHYMNSTSEPITVHAELDAIAYEPGTAVTPAATFLTYNNSLSIPPSSSKSETQVCAVPADVQFFAVSSHSHKQSAHTYIKDQAAIVFESTDFADPGSRKWTEAPFLTFASGQLTYQCDYVNPTDRTITSGTASLRMRSAWRSPTSFPPAGPCTVSTASGRSRCSMSKAKRCPSTFPVERKRCLEPSTDLAGVIGRGDMLVQPRLPAFHASDLGSGAAGISCMAERRWPLKWAR